MYLIYLKKNALFEDHYKCTFNTIKGLVHTKNNQQSFTHPSGIPRL